MLCYAIYLGLSDADFGVSMFRYPTFFFCSNFLHVFDLSEIFF